MIGLLQLFQLFLIDRLAALAPKLGLQLIRVDEKGNAIGPWDMKDEDVEVASQPTVAGQSTTMTRPSQARNQAAAASDTWEEQMRQNEARYWELSRSLTARHAAWLARLSPEERAEVEARRALRIANPRAYREAKRAELAADRARWSREERQEFDERRAARWNRRREAMAAWHRRRDELEQQVEWTEATLMMMEMTPQDCLPGVTAST